MSSKASSDEQLVQRFSRVMPLALIHTIIVQQSYYGCYGFTNDQFWTMADIVSAVEIFQNLSVWTKDKEAVSDLIAHVYSDHCLDLSDAAIIESAVKILLGNKHSPNATKGVASLLNKLCVAIRETNDLQKTLDSIDDRSAYAYYLTEERERLHTAKISKIFLKELVQATGAPELLLSEPHTGYILQDIAADVTATVDSHLAALPVLPDISVDQIMPIDAFFAQEMRAYKNSIKKIKSDMQTVTEALAGKITPTPYTSAILEAISVGEVPLAWLRSTFITCTSLDSWLKLLPVKIKYVQNCFNKSPTVLSVNMLMRPDRVFHVVKLSYASKHFKDLTNVNLEFQVMPNDFEPDVKPNEGLYISGLQLKNAQWDNTTASLTETISCTDVMNFPIIWVKPNVSESGLTKQLYLCPLYSSDDPKHQNDSTLLYFIPLSTMSPVVCAQRRVSLTLTQR
ncbi:hypothetical protein Btru_067437 [Bulinus truncatus]|nr:hypothetical protein Btru_067437 [Bulinus truncatus]